MLWSEVTETGLVPGMLLRCAPWQSPNRTDTAGAVGTGDTGEKNVLEIVRELGDGEPRAGI